LEEAGKPAPCLSKGFSDRTAKALYRGSGAVSRTVYKQSSLPKEQEAKMISLWKKIPFGKNGTEKRKLEKEKIGKIIFPNKKVWE
jgi:hypothetical protein